MCKVATVRYIARKTIGQLVRSMASLNLIKRGEGGKLSHIYCTKIKIEGDLTAKQVTKTTDACYVHRMIEGDWNMKAHRN
jgi:putative redox protein